VEETNDELTQEFQRISINTCETANVNNESNQLNNEANTNTYSSSSSSSSSSSTTSSTSSEETTTNESVELTPLINSNETSKYQVVEPTSSLGSTICTSTNTTTTNNNNNSNIGTSSSLIQLSSSSTSNSSISNNSGIAVFQDNQSTSSSSYSNNCAGSSFVVVAALLPTDGSSEQSSFAQKTFAKQRANSKSHLSKSLERIKTSKSSYSKNSNNHSSNINSSSLQSSSITIVDKIQSQMAANDFLQTLPSLGKENANKSDHNASMNATCSSSKRTTLYLKRTQFTPINNQRVNLKQKCQNRSSSETDIIDVSEASCSNDITVNRSNCSLNDVGVIRLKVKRSEKVNFELSEQIFLNTIKFGRLFLMQTIG
jgi:hypothetical protein